MKYLAIIFLFIICQDSTSQFAKTKVEQEKSKMIIYGSNTCHYCIDAKDYLSENKIEFIFYDIDVNILKQIEMIEKLSKANIPTSSINLPIVDKGGVIVMNSGNFNDFLKTITNE